MDDGPEPISVADSSEFAYSEARRLIDQAKQEAFSSLRADGRRRRAIVAGLFAAWLAVAVVLYFAVSPDMLVVGELGLAACVAFAVFYLMPSAAAKQNLRSAFDQYEGRLDKLEGALVPLPVCASIEELAAALAAIPVAGE